MADGQELLSSGEPRARTCRQNVWCASMDCAGSSSTLAMSRWRPILLTIPGAQVRASSHRSQVHLRASRVYPSLLVKELMKLIPW